MNYFGTDGIRGEYNSKLTIDLAFEVGKAAGTVLKSDVNNTICIGKDPRLSSDVIESALVAGLVATGVNVHQIGVVSTPVISYSIIHGKYSAGIMISASHNPYVDNGIKFFGSNGQKLSDELELEIESVLNSRNYNLVETKDLGMKAYKFYKKELYMEYLIDLGCDLSGVKIALDCANGSSYQLAPEIFKRLGAEIEVIGNTPNGININDEIGSTHPDKISHFIQEGDFDFGFTYDGDADRVLLLDSTGEILDGDHIIYFLAKHYKEQNKLNNNTVISTVMANLGMIKALKELDIEVKTMQVGDRYVMQGLNEFEAVVGGEQSGHIILPELLPTGDGILVSVILAKLIKQSSMDLVELSNQMQKFPQLLLNKKVASKDAVLNDEKLLAEIAKYEKELANSGRILVRASGTEELIRVMVECEDEKTCKDICEHLISFVN